MRRTLAIESGATLAMLALGWAFLFFFGSNYLRSLATLVAILYLLSLSVNIVMGFTDLVPFGQAAFFGIGAYVSALVAINSGAGMLGGAAAGIGLSVVVALITASASVRISGVYFSLATLAVAEIVRVVVLNWNGLTRGPMGLSLPADARTLVGSAIEVDREFMFFAVMLTAIVATGALFVFLRSDAGRRMVAVRENPDLAAALGVWPTQQRVLSFALGGIVASLAGTLYAFNYAIVTPEVAGVHYSALALLIVIFGGSGSLLGTLIGSIAFVLLPEYIGLDGTLGEVAFAVVLFVIVVLLPRGVVGSSREWFARRRSSADAELAGAKASQRDGGEPS